MKGFKAVVAALGTVIALGGVVMIVGPAERRYERVEWTDAGFARGSCEWTESEWKCSGNEAVANR